MPTQTVHRFLFFITCLAISISFLDRVIPEGMFMDGLFYAAVSRNIAEGRASFWQPMYNGIPFYDHPPCMFWLESFFFKLFGNHYSIERIFSGIVFYSTGFVVLFFWKKITKVPSIFSYGWIPLLFWYIAPTIIWTYPNNMLDALMALWDILAVYFLYVFVTEKRYINLFLGFLFIFLASFTKGPVGLFPIAFPFLYGVFIHRKNILFYIFISVLLAIGIVLSYVCMWYSPSAHPFLEHYFYHQLFLSINSKREVVGDDLGRYSILVGIGIQLAPMFILAGIIWGISKFKKTNVFFSFNHTAGLFLAIGFSASVPIVLSPKQSYFYLVPSIPYYAFAFSLFVFPILKQWMEQHYSSFFSSKKLYLLYIIGGVFLVSYVSFKWGKVGRDIELIHDIKNIEQQVPLGTKIGASDATKYGYWEFMAYANRYHALEITSIENASYAVVKKEGEDVNFEEKLRTLRFEKTPMEGHLFWLYRKQHK